MVGKNEKGVLYKVNSDTLELLPYTCKYRPFVGSKTRCDEENHLWLFTGFLLNSFNACTNKYGLTGDSGSEKL